MCKCGKEIPDNVKFCLNCGAEQAGAKPTAAPTSTQGNCPTAEAPKKRKNFLPAIFATTAVEEISFERQIKINAEIDSLPRPPIADGEWIPMNPETVEEYFGTMKR